MVSETKYFQDECLLHNLREADMECRDTVESVEFARRNFRELPFSAIFARG